MKKILLTIFCSLIMFSGVQAATSDRSFILPLTEAYIKYERLSWQNYEFWIISNLEGEELSYQWSIDDRELYNTESVRTFLNRGEHEIKVKVEDKYGNVIYDNVRLNIRFWSLQNNWFWWLIYLLAVLIILYYWIVKIIYLMNRRKVSKDVRYFLDVLDEHGWVERVIEHHCQAKRKTTRKKKTVKKNKK